MKKFILKFGTIVAALFFVHCDFTTKKNVKEKIIYYKVYSEKDSLIGYSIRKYEFNKDTITEKYLSINLSGKIINDNKFVFYKKGEDFYIFSNIKDDKSKYLYFTNSNKDTCFYINRKIESFYICKKGKTNFKSYRNVHKIYYDERGYDSRKETLILNLDFTILARFEECYNYSKEIISEENETSSEIKSKLEKVSKSNQWW